MAGRMMPQGPSNTSTWSSGPEYVAMNDPNSKTIRIRNLALDSSEDDLRRIFSQLGMVSDLWVAIDKYENQVGLAYCEFHESRAVQMAVQHLNGVQFKGYKIHIEPAPNHMWKDERTRVFQAMEELSKIGDGSQGDAAYEQEGGSSQESSGDDLANLNSEQMFNLMHQMKLCVEADPVEARNALLRNFTLSAGMLQALLMMKLVDPLEALDVLMREEQPQKYSAPPPAVVPQLNAPLRPPYPGHSLPVYQVPPVNVPPPSIPARPSAPRDPRQGRAMAFPDPYRTGQPSHPAPVSRAYPPAAPAAAEPAPNQSEMERAGMLLQLIQMTDQQLASLAPDQRQAVMMLREQLARQM